MQVMVDGLTYSFLSREPSRERGSQIFFRSIYLPSSLGVVETAERPDQRHYAWESLEPGFESRTGQPAHSQLFIFGIGRQESTVCVCV